MQVSPVVILVLVFATLLALGVAIAFCIALSTLAAMILALGFEGAMTTMAQIIANTDSVVLLAIPFFILAGQIMYRGGIARRIIDFAVPNGISRKSATFR